MIRERVKKQFFGEISPKRGWVGWLIPKQGPNPSKPPQITPKISFFDPKSAFRFFQISQKPWGGWVGKHLLNIGKSEIITPPTYSLTDSTNYYRVFF